MSRKTDKVKFDNIEFRIFCIQNYRTIKKFAQEHGLAYQTCKRISAGIFDSPGIVRKIEQIMLEERDDK